MAVGPTAAGAGVRGRGGGEGQGAPRRGARDVRRSAARGWQRDPRGRAAALYPLHTCIIIIIIIRQVASGPPAGA